MNQKMDRSLYLYVMKQLFEDLPSGLDDENDLGQIGEFGRRLEELIKIGYELTDTESCTVEIYSAMPDIREELTDDQWASLIEVITQKGEIQVIRVSLFGQPLIETGRFHECPVENAVKFMELPRSLLKGVVAGLVKVVRDNGLTVIDAYRGHAAGKVDVHDTFAALLLEVLDDEIEEAVSEFRDSLMAEVTAAQFTPWGPPAGPPADPLGGGE